MFSADYKGTILITCAMRTTEYLKKELVALGYHPLSQTDSGVFIEGSYQDCIKLNLYLRTAYRVLFKLKRFRAVGPDDLYKAIKKIQWEDILEKDGYFSIQSYVKNDSITDTRFANLKCKDAIVDRMQELVGQRPDSGPDTSKTVFYLYWKEYEAIIYLDTSGESIGKHGYRKVPMDAPVQESLASSIIYASGWDMDSNFINPMCGSGTLAIEAALMAIDKAPGLMRDNYSFMHVKAFREEYWQQLTEEAKAKIKSGFQHKIVASDINPEAISASKRNASIAGVEDMIEFLLCDFKETPIYEGGGAVMLNPEYGERLGYEEELEAVYKEIGDFFKNKCKGYKGYIFTGNMNLAKRVGLKAKRRIELYNAKIDCRLLEYELYEGTRRKVEESK